MGKVWEWTRNGLAVLGLVLGVLAVGLWLGAGRTVKAASSQSGVVATSSFNSPESTRRVRY